MAKQMLGLDFGTSELKIVQWNGQEITRALRFPTPAGLIRSGAITSYDEAAKFLRESVKAGSFKCKSCSVILPSNAVFLRNVTLPAMTVEQLRLNLPYEFRDFLDMPKESYLYDYAVRRLTADEEDTPTEMELMAAAVPKEIIDNYRRMFRKAGLRLQIAVPLEGAYANLLLRRSDTEGQEFAILDASYTATRLDIYTGRFYETTRIADVGLSDLDKAIAQAEGIEEPAARALREAYREDILESEAAQSVYLALATEVRKAVNFYGFSNRESNLQDIWFCGGGMDIVPLRRAVSEATNLQIHPIQELYPPLSPEIASSALYAAAIGAAIQ